MKELTKRQRQDFAILYLYQKGADYFEELYHIWMSFGDLSPEEGFEELEDLKEYLRSKLDITLETQGRISSSVRKKRINETITEKN